MSGDEVTIGPMPPGGTATRTARRVADQPGYGAEPTRRRRNAPSRHRREFDRPVSAVGPQRGRPRSRPGSGWLRPSWPRLRPRAAQCATTPPAALRHPPPQVLAAAWTWLSVPRVFFPARTVLIGARRGRAAIYEVCVTCATFRKHRSFRSDQPTAPGLPLAMAKASSSSRIWGSYR